MLQCVAGRKVSLLHLIKQLQHSSEAGSWWKIGIINCNFQAKIADKKANCKERLLAKIRPAKIHFRESHIRSFEAVSIVTSKDNPLCLIRARKRNALYIFKNGKKKKKVPLQGLFCFTQVN